MSLEVTVFYLLNTFSFRRCPILPQGLFLKKEGTVQYSTVQHSTVQYSTVQYSTIRLLCLPKRGFQTQFTGTNDI